MLEQVPAETIYSQIGHILEQYRAEAQRLVELTCGASSESGGDRTMAGEAAGSYVATGSVRQVGRLQGKVVQAGVQAGWVGGSESLLNFFRDQIDPYLRASSGTRLPLGRTRRNREPSSRPSRPASLRRPIRWPTVWRTFATSAGSSISRRGCISGYIRGWELMSPCQLH